MFVPSFRAGTRESRYVVSPGPMFLPTNTVRDDATRDHAHPGVCLVFVRSTRRVRACLESCRLLVTTRSAHACARREVLLTSRSRKSSRHLRTRKDQREWYSKLSVCAVPRPRRALSQFVYEADSRRKACPNPGSRCG